MAKIRKNHSDEFKFKAALASLKGNMTVVPSYAKNLV